MKKPWNCAIAALGLVIGLAARAGVDSIYPTGFMDAVSAFQSASPTNRYREADALQKELPTTPVKRVWYTGTASNFWGRGSRFVTRDLGKPSFILKQSEVLRLLGAPSSTNFEEFTYPVSSGAASRFPAFLSINFHNDYVVDSLIYSGPESKGFESDASPAKRNSSNPQR